MKVINYGNFLTSDPFYAKGVAFPKYPQFEPGEARFIGIRWMNRSSIIDSLKELQISKVKCTQIGDNVEKISLNRCLELFAEEEESAEW